MGVRLDVEEISRQIVDLRLRIEEIDAQIEEQGETPELVEAKERYQEKRRLLQMRLAGGGPATETGDETVGDEIRHIRPV